MATTRSSKGRHRAVPDPLAQRVGERVRRFRIERAFSFDAFVEETGLGRGYVSELERGLVVPTIATLAKAAEALGVTIADLVAGDSTREELLDVTLAMKDRDLARLLKEAKARVASYAPVAVPGLVRVAEPPIRKRPRD